jgi:hypothetical protein
MNRPFILFFIFAFLNVTFCTLSCYGGRDPNESSLDPPLNQESGHQKKDTLSKKVVRMTLNQNEPTEVKIGLQGITTLEFPAKIEAINGYGFALQPNLDTDAFSLTYDKGTNFLSLKALRPGVSANLTVVINEKVYCFFCEQDNDPCFVMIFGASGEKAAAPEGAEARSVPAEKKAVSRDQLVGFLGKLKDYSNLKVGSPDSISTLDVAEPNKKSGTGEIETLIKRIVRDDALGLVGFEIELSNRSQSDCYLDPERFAVRVGDATYEESISDSGGIVPAGTSVPAFFVVTDGGGSDLSVDQNFEVEIRTADHAQNPRVTQNFVEPPQNYLPTPTARDPGNGVKSGSSGKAESKGGKETAGKPKHTLEVASAKDHGTKTPVPSTKKHWWDLFKRNSVTSE